APLIRRYFHPYARAMTDAVADRLAATGRAVVIDVHSYPRAPLPYELHGEGPRPPVCLGTDPFHTPPALLAAAREAFAPCGETGLDSPFAGTYVPLEFFGKRAEVSALMVEIRRDTYMTEPGGPAGPGLDVLASALAGGVAGASGCRVGRPAASVGPAANGAPLRRGRPAGAPAAPPRPHGVAHEQHGGHGRERADRGAERPGDPVLCVVHPCCRPQGDLGEGDQRDGQAEPEPAHAGPSGQTPEEPDGPTEDEGRRAPEQGPGEETVTRAGDDLSAGRDDGVQELGRVVHGHAHGQCRGRQQRRLDA